MGLCTVLVREFQSWIGSGASRPVADAAARTYEGAIASVARLPLDSLKLSPAARRRVAGVQPAAPSARTGQGLIRSRSIAMNRINGDRRELIVERFLKQRFRSEAGYGVHAEQYLRDAKGRIALDPKTGESRRLDFVVFQGKKVISTVEVTSRTASKVAQSAKEQAIRSAGGRYLLVPETGKLVKLSPLQRTAVLRLI